VEVALMREIPDAIAPLLAAERAPIPAEETTTAVFYSISNTQRGLAGVSFGDFLIKQVVEDLQRSLPNLKTFVTLSPVPGFAAWLALQRAGGSESEFLDEAGTAALAALDDPAWPEDAAKAEALRRPLLAAAAYYFLKAKLSSGLPVDPVARFHLRNGARLERINFMADLSRRGLDQAHGLMTNYLYDLDQIEKNHEAFAAEGRFAAAPAVRKLLLTPAPARRRGVAS
jgi:malonyl-CoA decarboxylase